MEGVHTEAIIMAQWDRRKGTGCRRWVEIVIKDNKGFEILKSEIEDLIKEI